MRILLMYLVASLLLLTACADHYYIVRGDMVHFTLELPDAEKVLFLSSLDGYEIHEAKKIREETWVIDVPANNEFKYFFIVDGEHFLPACELKEVDDFGSANCIFTKEM